MTETLDETVARLMEQHDGSFDSHWRMKEALRTELSASAVQGEAVQGEAVMKIIQDLNGFSFAALTPKSGNVMPPVGTKLYTMTALLQRALDDLIIAPKFVLETTRTAQIDKMYRNLSARRQLTIAALQAAIAQAVPAGEFLNEES